MNAINVAALSFYALSAGAAGTTKLAMNSSMKGALLGGVALNMAN